MTNTASRFPSLPRLPRFRASALMHFRTLALAHFFLLPLVSIALTEGNYTYTVSSGKAAITDFNSSYSGPLSIPSTLGGYPVTSIGDSAFYDCTSLTSATIPDSVTSIGGLAFERCFALTSVTIPDSVTSIGKEAFYACTNLTSVTIPDSVTTVGSAAFFACYSLASVTIPDSVTSISDYAFASCRKLTFVTIPDSVTSIADRAFSSCPRLASILFTGDAPTINLYTFDSTPATLYYLPDTTGWSTPLAGRTTKPLVEYSSASDRITINHIDGSYTGSYLPIPATITGRPVTSIGSEAFSGCKSLVSVTIPDSVASIGDRAFSSCTNLTSVTIPAGVTNIGMSAFYNCTSLTGAYFKGDAPLVSDSAFSNATKTTVYRLPYAEAWPSVPDPWCGRPTAYWTLMVTAMFDPLGGTVYQTSKTVTNGIAYGALPMPIRDGYTFGGWWSGADGTLTQVIDMTIVTAVSDHTLTAAWTANGYTVTFAANGVELEPASKVVAFNSTYGELPVLVRMGYTFQGWRAETNGVTFAVNTESVVAIAGDHTLTAAWAANGYTVTFDANGGAVDPGKKIVTFDAPYGELRAPVRAGYTFQGWRCETNGVTFAVTSESVVAVADNHTLTAAWTVNEYTVTFETNGGEVNPADKAVIFGGVYGELPAPVRPGYTFGGWWTVAGGTGTQVTDATLVSTAADHTLYALWAPNGHTVGVSNLRVEQRAGTKLVDIWYDVPGTSNEALTVSLNLNNGEAAVPASSLSGDIGIYVYPGTDKHIVWDAGADLAGYLSENMLLKLSVSSNNFMVVDLSGGPSATSYPVDYLTFAPAGGWTDEHTTTKLVLRKIPAGTFTMGSPEVELGRDNDETPHQVTLTKDFHIGVFEVTQRQWELVMGNKPSYFNNSTYYQKRPVEQVSYYDIRENPANSDDSAVDWPSNSAVNADSFMGKIRAKTGLAGFDLPTESQWEYACRAGTTAALNSGYNLTNESSDARMSEVGRYFYNGGSAYSPGCAPSAGTALAGSYLPNAWGLYDMHGNVYEWCLDWYGTYPGSVSDPKGAASGSGRMVRGGSWFVDAGDCRSALRVIYINRDARGCDLGFRAAMTLP